MRRSRVCFFVFRKSFILKILFEFLQPFWYVGIRASPTCSRSSFFLILEFRLVHAATLLVFQKCADFTVLVYPHFHLTRLLDDDLTI